MAIKINGPTTLTCPKMISHLRDAFHSSPDGNKGRGQFFFFEDHNVAKLGIYQENLS